MVPRLLAKKRKQCNSTARNSLLRRERLKKARKNIFCSHCNLMASQALVSARNPTKGVDDMREMW